jgi:hypothetical protein
MDVKEALAQVDALDNDNFTSDGNVKVDVVSKIAGRSVTRQEIIDAAPAFNKANPVVETTAEAKDAEGLKDPITNGELNDTEPKTAGGGTVPAGAVRDTDPKSAGGDMDRPTPQKKAGVDVIKNGKVITDDLDEQTEELDMEDIDVSALREFQNADPMNERDFVSFLGDVPSNNLHGLEEMLIEQQSEVESQIATLEEMRDNVRRSLAYTRSRIKVEIPDVDNQSAIRAFIASQTAQRSAKAETAAKVRSMINVHDLDPRSTIDRAMARRTERGGKRPVKI